MSRPVDEERVRRRAYELWEAEGRPEGRELAHWVAAEAELEASAGAGAGRGDESPAGESTGEEERSQDRPEGNGASDHTPAA